MVYKLTSVNLVLAKIIRDLGFNQSNDEIPINDFIEWIAEALLQVGSFQQLTQKRACLKIHDYKAKLPCDLHSITKVYHYNWPYIDHTGLNKNLIVDKDNPYSYLKDGGGYNINFDTVTVAFREGNFEFDYLAFPVDEEGFPLIPDLQSFRDLLFWKIVYQLAIRGHNFTNPQLKDINFSRQKYNYYILQARGEANTPDETNMPHLARMFKSWHSGLYNRYGHSYNYGHFWNSYKF